MKPLAFREHASVEAGPMGLKVFVEESKFMQATLYLGAETFGNYNLHPAPGCAFVSLRIPLNVFCESLNMLDAGSHATPSVKISYAGQGHPLEVIVEEGGVIIQTSIKTLVPEDIMDLNFDRDSMCSRIIMKPEALYDTFNDLDTSSPTLEIAVEKEPRRLTLQTEGLLGTTCFEFPATSDIIELFECDVKHRNRYRLSVVRRMAKSLHVATKVSIRTDKAGQLSFQFMIERDDRSIFIEFHCLPDVEEYD